MSRQVVACGKGRFLESRDDPEAFHAPDYSAQMQLARSSWPDRAGVERLRRGQREEELDAGSV